MKLFLVDDNDNFRTNLKKFLEEYFDYEVVGEACNGLEFLNKVDSSADIILMDLNMPEMDGFEATRISISKKLPLKIIALSQSKEFVDLQKLKKIGCKGYVSKTELFDVLEKAILNVSKGGYYFPASNEI